MTLKYHPIGTNFMTADTCTSSGIVTYSITRWQVSEIYIKISSQQTLIEYGFGLLGDKKDIKKLKPWDEDLASAIREIYDSKDWQPKWDEVYGYNEEERKQYYIDLGKPKFELYEKVIVADSKTSFKVDRIERILTEENDGNKVVQYILSGSRGLHNNFSIEKYDQKLIDMHQKVEG
jgi:hypothetical protein